MCLHQKQTFPKLLLMQITFSCLFNLFIFILIIIPFKSGESGIRTHGTRNMYTRFPSVLLKPLGHLSERKTYRETVFFSSAENKQNILIQKKKLIKIILLFNEVLVLLLLTKVFCFYFVSSPAIDFCRYDFISLLDKF